MIGWTLVLWILLFACGLACMGGAWSADRRARLHASTARAEAREAEALTRQVKR